MIQKIIRVGNSAAITIPKEFVKEAGFKIGDEMVVETNAQSKMILAKPRHASGRMSLSPEFFTWLNDVSIKYEDTIKELARK